MQKQYINESNFKRQPKICSVFENVSKRIPEQHKKISKDYETIREHVTGHQNTSQKKDTLKINII